MLQTSSMSGARRIVENPSAPFSRIQTSSGDTAIAFAYGHETAKSNVPKRAVVLNPEALDQRHTRSFPPARPGGRMTGQPGKSISPACRGRGRRYRYGILPPDQDRASAQ